MRTDARAPAWLPALLFLLTALAVRAPALPFATLDPDEGLFLTQAFASLQGGWPYVAVWDMHPPGAPALLVPLVALPPDPVVALRLAAVLAVTATLLHALARRLGAAPAPEAPYASRDRHTSPSSRMSAYQFRISNAVVYFDFIASLAGHWRSERLRRCRRTRACAAAGRNRKSGARCRLAVGS